MSEGHTTAPSTILIIDDKPADLKALVRFLEERGFRIAIARGGRRGVETPAACHAGYSAA